MRGATEKEADPRAGRDRLGDDGWPPRTPAVVEDPDIMPTDASRVWRLFDADTREAEPVRVAGGHAALLSTPAPDKQGPNEDAAAVVDLADGSGVLVVADGMGGGPRGEAAARTAIECVVDAVLSSDAERDSLRSHVLDGIERANLAVMELGVGAGTTLAAVEINGTIVRPYHVGDSSILVTGQRGRVKIQTIAHSPVGYAVEAGILDEEQALQHDERHLVSNVVGVPDMRIDVGSPKTLGLRDTVLLGSDGLFDNLGSPEIIETIRKGPIDRAARSLAEACMERMQNPVADAPSKPDDLTLIVYRRDATPTRRSS